MPQIRNISNLTVRLGVACVTAAMSPAPHLAAQALPPVRQITMVVASARDRLGQVPSVRALSTGSILVNDYSNRRVLLMDSTLAIVRVVLDTTPGVARNYPDRPGSLVPYLADSTLFVDTRAISLLVIDPMGAIARVIAPPRPADISSLRGSAMGSPRVDPRGRIVYGYLPNKPPVHADGTPMTAGDTVDVPILRATLTDQSIDTAAIIRLPLPPSPTFAPDATGRQVMTRMVFPLSGMGPPRTDVYAVALDGSIAVVRVQDYHVDWMRADGTHEATAKIPHDWHRLSDAEKQHLADSTTAAFDSVNTRQLAGATNGSIPMVYRVQAAQDIPDYATPFVATPPMVDLAGNLWIASNNYPKPDGGPLYDIVNPRGVLIDRVQIPKGCTLAGLGRNVAYVTSREGMTTSLVAMRLR